MGESSAASRPKPELTQKIDTATQSRQALKFVAVNMTDSDSEFSGYQLTRYTTRPTDSRGVAALCASASGGPTSHHPISFVHHLH